MRRGATAVALLAGLMLAAPTPAVAEHSVVELISTGPGPDGGTLSFFVKASPDGRRVLFGTDSALVPEDVDNCDEPDFDLFRLCYDGYERFAGQTSLLTTGPADQHRSVDIVLEAASRDRTRAFFNTSEPLVPEDTNTVTDAYERTAGATTLLSVGLLGQGAGSSILTGASEDGARAFFQTANRLAPEDEDDCGDFYERSAGTTKLLSTGVPTVPSNFRGCARLFWAGSSADGSRVFLATDAAISPDDGDEGVDLYEWRDGEVTLISNGPGRRGDGGFIDDRRVIVSRDGNRIFFRTSKQLVPEDTEGGRGTDDYDLYEHADGTTRLLIPPVPSDSSPQGTFGAMSEDGSRVYFRTSAALVPEDTNGLPDVYVRVGGELELVTTGPLGNPGGAQLAGDFPSGDGTLAGVSADGRAAVFASSNRFTPEDTDSVQDIYLRANGETRLVSTGPADESEDVPVRVDVVFSPDGSRVFMATSARFVAEDTDGLSDVYEWHQGQTTLVPHGVPTPDPIGLVPEKTAIVRDGSRIFIGADVPLTPNDTDDQHDLYAVDLPNSPPECNAVTATPALLSPANGRLVPVALGAATDPDGDDVSIEITAVTQDEPTARSRDAVLSSAGDEVRLRAERDNRGDGRVYRIEFEATDGNGGSCPGTATVAVPRKKKQAAVDSAPPSYDSLG